MRMIENRIRNNISSCRESSLNIEQEIHTYAYRLLYALVLVHEKITLVFMQLLLASERSERDTYRGKNEKIGDVCLFICIYV